MTKINRWSDRLIIAGVLPLGLWLAVQTDPIAAEGSVWGAIVNILAIIGLSVAIPAGVVMGLLRLSSPMRSRQERDRCSECRIWLNFDTLTILDRRIHGNLKVTLDRDALVGVEVEAGHGGSECGVLLLEMDSGHTIGLMLRAPLTIIGLVAEEIAKDYRYVAMLRAIDDSCGTLPLFGREVA